MPFCMQSEQFNHGSVAFSIHYRVVFGIWTFAQQYAMLATSSGRCFKPVDSVLEQHPKLIAVDEQFNHQIVHPFGLGETNRPTHQPLDPRPQVDMLALDFLCLILANTMLLGIKMTLVCTPAIRVIFCDPKRPL